MKNGFWLIILIFITPSCNKVKDYFRDPDTEALSGTIQSATLTGYSATIAISVMKGHTYPFVSPGTRSNDGFPCTTLMMMDLNESDYPFSTEKAGTVTIAGLWADENTGILSMIYTDYQAGDNTLDLVGIETVPVILEGNNIHLAMASQDISLNPDQQAILSINLNTLQIQSELLRLDMPRPSDVYVAVVQNAYFIDINTQGTFGTSSDDDCIVTGGGQLVTVAGNSAEIIQQAMVDVKISSDCRLNPLQGMALIKVTGLEDEGFPELGTAVLEFSNDCDASAKVFAATGMYVGSNGSHVDFYLR